MLSPLVPTAMLYYPHSRKLLHQAGRNRSVAQLRRKEAELVITELLGLCQMSLAFLCITRRLVFQWVCRVRLDMSWLGSNNGASGSRARSDRLRPAQFWESGEKAMSSAFPSFPPLAVEGVRSKGQKCLLPLLSPMSTTDSPLSLSQN